MESVNTTSVHNVRSDNPNLQTYVTRFRSKLKKMRLVWIFNSFTCGSAISGVETVKRFDKMLWTCHFLCFLLVLSCSFVYLLKTVNSNMFLLKPDWEITVYFSFLFKHNIACFFAWNYWKSVTHEIQLAREHNIKKKNI